MIRETELYAPLRDYLEGQGYEVKSEILHCDMVALRGDDPPLIVELKSTLNLELVLQAADRLKVSESVYIAFPASAPLWRNRWKRVRTLCQRLGVGIITLDLKSGRVKVRLDPLPYRPRENRQRKHRLLAEFDKRVGDPNTGGMSRQPIITAYRQDALRCLASLEDGPLALADIREASGVERAGSILQKDHYGWFERVSRGCYRLSPRGSRVIGEYQEMIEKLDRASGPPKQRHGN